MNNIFAMAVMIWCKKLQILMMLVLFSVKRSDYRIHFWYTSKDDAINIMKHSNLNEKTQWTYLRWFADDSTSKFHVKSSSLFHRWWKTNPRGKDVDSMLTRLSKAIKCRWALHMEFLMSFRCRINVFSKLVIWRNTDSSLPFCVAVSNLF